MVAWIESGLFVSNLIDLLKVTTAPKWTDPANKIALYDNTLGPDFTLVSASAIYGNAGLGTEKTGTNYPAGGLATTVAAAGAGALTPTLTQSPTKSVMADFTADVSVASTTISSPGAYGAVIYADGLTPKAAIMGLWFGGLGYPTTAGTFAITFAALGVWVIKCVPSGA